MIIHSIMLNIKLRFYQLSWFFSLHIQLLILPSCFSYL